MTIEGITFDLMKVTPADDALIYQSVYGDRILNNSEKMNVTATGLNVYVAPGNAVVQGRLIKITSPERLSIPANSSGWICLTIDLTQVNSFTGTPGSTNYKPVNNQVRLEIVNKLVQQDLMTTGKLYTFPIASYSSNASTTYVVDIPSKGLDTGWVRMQTPSTVTQNNPLWIKREFNTIKFSGTCQIPNNPGDLIYEIPTSIGKITRDIRIEFGVEDSNTNKKCIIRTMPDQTMKVEYSNSGTASIMWDNIKIEL